MPSYEDVTYVSGTQFDGLDCIDGNREDLNGKWSDDFIEPDKKVNECGNDEETVIGIT